MCAREWTASPRPAKKALAGRPGRAPRGLVQGGAGEEGLKGYWEGLFPALGYDRLLKKYDSD